jgi:hypothetical protein
MIAALIAKPPPRTRTLETPTTLNELKQRHEPTKSVGDAPRHQVANGAFERHDAPDDDEEAYITKLILMLVALLIVPAILMMVYLIIYPDSLMYNITPNRDFSSSHPGTSR